MAFLICPLDSKLCGIMGICWKVQLDDLVSSQFCSVVLNILVKTGNDKISSNGVSQKLKNASLKTLQGNRQNALYLLLNIKKVEILRAFQHREVHRKINCNG